MNKQLLLTLILATASGPLFAQAAAKPARTPQPVARAAFLQRIDAGFSAIDTNKDGFTDRAELEAADAKTFAARKSQALKQREAAFRQMDKDKNGSLSLQEFNAATAAQPQPKANAAPTIARLDTNKDGKISAAENRAPAAAQFDRADANKDGTLSVDEQKVRRQR